MRCLTRLTNAFSKKIENLEHAVALHFMHYNFAWSLKDIVTLASSNGPTTRCSFLLTRPHNMLYLSGGLATE